jgi:hypothetical protein
MEYYINMRPNRPFNAIVVGKHASMQQIMFSPEEHARSRSNSPNRSSMVGVGRKENGQDRGAGGAGGSDGENNEEGEGGVVQKKKTTVLMKKDGVETTPG